MGISNEGKDSKTPPGSVHLVERKSELKLLGVTFHENPRNWDSHFHNMIDKANSRLYILRTCKYYGYTLEELTILFHSLIICQYLHMQSKYGRVLMVVNTSLRSIN